MLEISRNKESVLIKVRQLSWAFDAFDDKCLERFGNKVKIVQKINSIDIFKSNEWGKK